MDTDSDLALPTASAAPGVRQAATSPRIKVLANQYAIDHPDLELGEAAMADMLGAPDRDAMEGLLRQLVRAGASDGGPDEVNISFALSMAKSIRPRDAIEAMLVAQMVSVHTLAMRCAHRLAATEDPAQHDGAARALARLARTFPAQIDALNRHRSRGEPNVTVQNVSVGDGGNAIVGNVTQHARVVVERKRAGASRQRDRDSGGRDAEA